MPAVKNLEIRQRRQRLGLKLGQFAERAGIKYQTYANIESGCQVPSIEMVWRIANAFATEDKPCEAGDLLADEDGRVAA